MISTDENDAPETPAPVFAARAIKSAIFGTPGREGEYALEEDSPIPKTVIVANSRLEIPQGFGTESPTKPQGILLTPGTATTRRKTVTFGAAVVDNEEKTVGKSGMPNNCPGKFPSPWTPKVDRESQSRHTRKTNLTRTLEAARDEKLRKLDNDINKDTCVRVDAQHESDTPVQRESGNVDLKGRSPKRMRASSPESCDGDITLDLNEPHSQSGRYWKSEYERYHEEAKAQMKKLVKYKQLAKSYAKKKDSEAIDLGEKLKEEQRKVVAMEDRISDLIAQIADSKTNEEDTPHLIRELAKQTALAVQYRDQVDDFQAALQERDEEIDRQEAGSGSHTVSPRTAKTLLETTKELRKARRQLGEMTSLRAEMNNLRVNLQAAENRASKLREENSRLSEDLTRVRNELLSGQRQQNGSQAQHLPQVDEVLQLQNDYDVLKELAKSQRRDAEHLLKKRHDQVVELRKEIASLKKLASSSHEDQTKVPVTNDNGGPRLSPALHGGVTTKDGSGDFIDLISIDTSERGGPRKRVPTHTRLQSTQKSRPASSDGESPLNSKSPVRDRLTVRQTRDSAANDQKRGDGAPAKNLTRRFSQPALGEISNNNAVTERQTTRNETAPASPFTASFQERFSNLSLDSPAARLPSLEPSWNPSNPASTAKSSVLGPRPGVFNIPSSPPKHILPRPQSSGIELNTKCTNVPSSSRLSSLNSTRARIVLPPERAAAAKARLEQKKRESRDAERKKLQEVDEGKENICN